MIRDTNCLHTRFEAQSAAAPGAPALTFAGDTLSYGELNARANRLARHLRHCGAGPGERVGLCLDRNVDPVVAILAVLKTGAAYVPMDPVYPAERVRTIVEDAQCPIVVAHGEHQDRFSDGETTVIVLDGAERPWERESADNLDVAVSPSDLAYVIYTSGSTGKPKGALVTHWNVYRLFEAMQPDFGFRSDDVWTFFHSYAFDFSVSEMWGALFFGGRIVMVPYLLSRTPEEFYQLLIDEGVTVLNQTPSAFKQIQHHDESLPLEVSRRLALRYVLVGGEYMSLPSLAPWFERHGDERPRIIHVYGITETTVFVTYRFLTKADAAPGTPSFIGKAIKDLYLHILDENRRPVAVGEVGELYIGGPGVCLGYLNRPDLTAERFVPDPLDTTAFPPTLYKSGDLVRLFEDDLEFVGRNDNQVQLRGFRVELGEIEAELSEAPGIRSAIVRLREDIPGDPRLVAYYLALEPIALGTLREHLLRTLPPYMVPSAFVHLNAFPLNNNGKIENDALPAPTYTTALDAAYTAPRTETERALADLWQELLGASRVGVDDDFYQLGGHSLLITRLLLRIRDQFSVALPLRFVMENATLAAQAKAIDQAITSGETSSAPDSMGLADRSAPLPLSFAQERLWIVERLDPENTTYHVPLLFEIHGAVHAERLQRALDAVVARHEALRTVFTVVGDSPRQTILPAGNVPFQTIELNSEDEDPAASARNFLSGAAREAISLEQGPMLKATLLRAGAERAYLGIVVHHAVFDGWSISVLLDDLAASYTAQERGESATLPPLSRQYVDYSQWQREEARTSRHQQQLAYWKEHLAGPIAPLDFPADHVRPPRQTWAGHVAQRRVDSVLTRAAEQLAADNRSTLFVVLAAAWNVLLHRYTGQSDIVTGSVIAGRNHPGLENLIGFFVNTVALRTNVEREQRFLDCLGAVESAVLGAQENQDVPFDQVVAEVHHERDPSRSPLFQVLFVFHNTPPFETSFSGLHISGEEISNGGAKFDLSLSIQPRDGALILNLEYNTALFKAATAERILSNFSTLLASAVASPTTTVGALEMLDAVEKKLLLETWTDTSFALDRSQSLHELFEARAAAHPDAIAVADDEVSLTFSELDRRANQLAHYLLSRGVTREEPVPFFLGRTVRVMVAIIGILKAGAAYVPLDLLDPPGRRARVLSVLKPRLILTEDELAPQLSDTAMECVCLDEPGLLDGFATDSPCIGASGENLAYVIFTSGSTGDPKGVCCTHQGVINLYQDLQSRLPVGPGDACSIWTAFSFDVSVYESWTSLLAGATLHIIPERVRANPEACLEWLRAREVVTGYIPGFMLPTLLETQRRAPLPWRRLLVGVEPLSEALLSDIVEATPDLVLLNLYGPTEAAIYVTLYQAHDTHPRPTGNAPIGKAIQNTRIYVLDPAMNPLPVGVPGELYIGGVGLARGYYNDPELTEKQFVPDPFSDRDTSRLYRTGDLVFFKPDGNIQFIRRMDRYIKLRGYRIEPGEIESVLRTHPEIDDAVAVLFEKDPDNPRIVAYLVPCGQPAPDEKQLGAWLRDRLPGHMRPAQFVFIPAFPRTVQGKLDRKTLPDPPGHQLSEGVRVAPRSDLEARLVALWEALLGLSNIGVRENFFAIGGHSLLAIRMISRISSDFGVALPLRTFMEAPTIAECAAAIEAAKSAAGRGTARFAIPHADRSKPIPLSHAQKRLWILDQLRPGLPVYNVPLRIRIHGALKRDHLEQALSLIVARHEALRTVFSAKSGEPEQRVLPATSLSATFLSLVDHPEVERESRYRARALEIARRPMNLAEGPMLLADLVQFEPEEHSLTVLVHHMAFDGWSIRVFLEELADACQAVARGENWQPPALSHQYADYAAWQRNLAESPEMATELDYWRRQLAGPLPVLDFPTDFPRPKVQTWNGARIHGTLDRGLSEAVDALARSLDATPFALLLAGWKALLFRHTGQEDVIVGAALAGRDQQEWEPLIGFFVNTVALRTRVARDLPFERLVARVRDVALDAQEHQTIPFDRVLAEVQPERDQSRSPVFQMMFVLHNTPRYEAKRPALELSAEGLDNGGAKFDFSLSVTPENGTYVLDLEYNTALYAPARMAELLEHFSSLLESATAEPERTLGRLKLLSKPAAAPGAAPGCDIDGLTPNAPGLCLHQLFEAKAHSTPDAPAVTCEGTTLSYGELNARANRLARHLQDEGVGPDVLVGLCLDRSIDTVMAILAILKAGGAYVPMDPAYPAERVRMIVDDAQCPLVIAHRAHAGQFAGIASRVVVLDGIDTPWEEGLGTNLNSPVADTNLAYVIYTSGSTGTPKGALISHGNAVFFVSGMEHWFPIAPDDTWTLFHSYAFDFSVWEMWGAFLGGGRLVIVPLLVSRSPQAFHQLLRDERVTVLGQTPAAFTQLQLYDDTLPLETSRKLALRLVVLGGEALVFSSLASWFNRHGDQNPRLINLYGITETSVVLTCRPLTATDALPGTPSYIGTAIPGVALHVLNEAGQPVACGEVGELFVGGPGVGQGYLRRPQLTAERFLPDPFAPSGASTRLYKTGDLVRVLDGDLEFLGRNDSQIQLRGFRVELGEIEAALNNHDAVRSAIVRLREDVPGDPRLAAYYLAASPLPAQELREHVLKTLPPYMAPSSYTHLTAFPLTNNGKIDMVALPLPVDAVAAGEASEEPLSPREQKIALLWQDILRVGRTGRHDNFFTLGGHSLLAIRLLAVINETFGSALTLADFFDNPTIAGVANRLEQGATGDSTDARRKLFEIKPGTGTPFFCVKGAGDVGGSYDTFAGALSESQSFYGFPSLDFDDNSPATIEHLARRCIDEMKAVRPDGPYYIGGYSFGGIVAYEIARQLLEAGESVPLIAMLDSAAPDHSQVKRSLSREYFRHVFQRVRARLRTFFFTWKMHVGYLRDGAVLLFRRAIFGRRPDAQPLGLLDYLRWMQFDTSVQYYLIQAGLATPTIGEQRLKMVEDQLVRSSARSVTSSQNAVAEYTMEPIEGQITLFRAEHNPWGSERRDPTYGWGQYARKGVRVVEVPGNHMVIIRHPYAIGLGKALQGVIDELESGKA